jgi:hypothetical protein
MEKEIINVDELLEWGDGYDGDLDELDPYDYETDEEMEAADEERRRQYWRLTGTVAVSRAAWEAALEKEGAEKGSEYWIEAEKVAERFRNLMDEEYGRLTATSRTSAPALAMIRLTASREADITASKIS